MNEDHDYWPVHQPFAYEAPIPGLNWYSGCDPDRPRVNPETGICESCGATACPTCGSEIVKIKWAKLGDFVRKECQCKEPV